MYCPNDECPNCQQPKAELKPCPFCSSQSIQIHSVSKLVAVICEICWASTDNYFTTSDAIAAWNTRHQAPSGVEALRVEILDYDSALNTSKEEISALKEWQETERKVWKELYEAEIAALNAKLEIAKEFINTCKYYLKDGEPVYQFSVEKLELLAKMEK